MVVKSWSAVVDVHSIAVDAVFEQTFILRKKVAKSGTFKAHSSMGDGGPAPFFVSLYWPFCLMLPP